MRIVFAASEAVPFSKTGGLGDVVSGLSKALVKKGQKVSVFLPFYLKTKWTVLDNYQFVDSFEVAMGSRMVRANILKDVKNGVTFYFVENGAYFERENFYSYPDDEERFSFFSQAVKKAILRLNLRPQIVHVHDWQTAIVPLLLADAGLKFRSLLTIHNPAFQGYFNPYNLGSYLNLAQYYYDSGLIKFNNQVSLLKGGITTCDAISTVSITHAKELISDYKSFNGLGYILHNREKDLFGIVNGIDYQAFDPSKDKLIPQDYSYKNYKTGKKKNKKALLEAFGLTNTDLDRPIFSIVSRLTNQKGIDRVLRNIENIVKQDAILLVLGQGENEIEQALKHYSELYPNNIKIYLGYNEVLSHLVYAGSDFFLMPSKFEPCGLGQIIAMHYGTLPLVSKVGGLNDTVISYYEDSAKATGLSFANWDENCFDYSIYLLSKMYKEKDPILEQMILRAMKVNFSWSRQVNKYIELYKELLKR